MKSSEKKISSKDKPVPVINYKTYLEQSKVEFLEKFEREATAQEKPISLNNFEQIHTVGLGTFGRVVLIKNKQSNIHYAMKIINKEHIIRLQQVQHLLSEKKVLEAVNHPFVTNMEFSFKDNSYIYFVMPYLPGGELFFYLRRDGQFSEKLCKFYTAQIVLAIEYLHFLNLVHRDIKPENVVMDRNGYIKVTDFGFCKMVKGRTWSFCGTPEYLSPEIIQNKGYGLSVDWWSVGVLIYEMAAGYTPFYSKDHLKIYDKIITCEYQAPNFFSCELKDLIYNLLQVDLTKRFGNLKNGVADIKNHPWFFNVDWLKVLNMQIEPPFLPKLKGENDYSCFNNYQEEVMSVASVDLFQKEFEDF